MNAFISMRWSFYGREEISEYEAPLGPCMFSSQQQKKNLSLTPMMMMTLYISRRISMFPSYLNYLDANSGK